MAAEKPEYIINWHTHEKPLKEEEHKLKSEKTEIFLPRDSLKKKKKEEERKNFQIAEIERMFF